MKPTLVNAIVTFRVERLPRKEALVFARQNARDLIMGNALYSGGSIAVASVRFPKRRAAGTASRRRA